MVAHAGQKLLDSRLDGTRQDQPHVPHFGLTHVDRVQPAFAVDREVVQRDAVFGTLSCCEGGWRPRQTLANLTRLLPIASLFKLVR
jgi:hypothetical protein